MQSKTKIEFSEQLNDFEADMEDDLNDRASTSTGKWEFDFTKRQPLKQKSSSTSQPPMQQKSMSWEPIEVQSSPQQQLKLPRVRLIAKPKMNVSFLTADKDRVSILSGGSFGQRQSLFGNSCSLNGRLSTAVDSMFGSMVESVGKTSIVDLQSSFGQRTSLARNMLQQVRRAGIQEEVREQSEGGGSSSLNDRCSSNVEDTPVNAIAVLAISASQSRSDEPRVQQLPAEEEFKDSVERSNQINRPDGFVDHSMYASHRRGRLHSGIKSFQLADNVKITVKELAEDANPGAQQDPFAEPSEAMNNHDICNDQQEEEEEEEECNAEDDVSEYSAQKIPPIGQSFTAATVGKTKPTPAAFGPPCFK